MIKAKYTRSLETLSPLGYEPSLPSMAMPSPEGAPALVPVVLDRKGTNQNVWLPSLRYLVAKSNQKVSDKVSWMLHAVLDSIILAASESPGERLDAEELLWIEDYSSAFMDALMVSVEKCSPDLFKQIKAHAYRLTPDFCPMDNHIILSD